MTDPQWAQALELYDSLAGMSAPEAGSVLASSQADLEVLDAVTRMLGSLPDPAELSSPAASKTGLTLGRYEVGELLGSGAAGAVYKGRDTSLARAVALKFMVADPGRAASATQKFLREAQSASALNHPNIVTVHEVLDFSSTTGSTPVIVMEFIDGQPLRQLLRQPLPLPQVRQYAAQILQALAAAHAGGIVHRDLKPENVMVRPDGYLKVLDFGLARRLTGSFSAGGDATGLSSTAGLPVGTLRYMSPEQCRGESATPASDIFAAGLMFYEMATGGHPFAADSPLDTAHAIVWSEPKPAPASPFLLLALGMLTKDPAQRPSAAELLPTLNSERPTVVPARPAWLLTGALAAILAGLALWWLYPRTPVPIPVFNPLTHLSTQNYVTAVALSPDGLRYAFADLDGAVHLRFLNDTPEQMLVSLPNDRIDSIAWIARQPRLLLSGRDLSADSYTYRTWVLDIPSRKISALPVAGREAAASPDGSRLAFLSANGSEIWVASISGLDSHRLVAHADSATLKSFFWSPAGQRLHYWTVPEGRRHRVEWKSVLMRTVDSSTGKLLNEQSLPPGRLPVMLADAASYTNPLAKRIQPLWKLKPTLQPASCCPRQR